MEGTPWVLSCPYLQRQGQKSSEGEHRASRADRPAMRWDHSERRPRLCDDSDSFSRTQRSLSVSHRPTNHSRRQSRRRTSLAASRKQRQCANTRGLDWRGHLGSSRAHICRGRGRRARRGSTERSEPPDRPAMSWDIGERRPRLCDDSDSSSRTQWSLSVSHRPTNRRRRQSCRRTTLAASRKQRR